MLIIQIALGIVLAFFLIAFIVSDLAKWFTLGLIVIAIVYCILAFLIDKLSEPARKRHYEESWKRFNDQRQK